MRISNPHGAPGFVLLEVAAAAALLLVAALGIAPALLRAQAALSREADLLVAEAANPGEWGVSDRMFSWGPRITDASVSSETVTVAGLEVTDGGFSSPEQGRLLLGLWSDGTLLTEVEVASVPAQFPLPAHLLQEQPVPLTLRIRRESAGWGPPWRVLYPTASVSSFPRQVPETASVAATAFAAFFGAAEAYIRDAEGEIHAEGDEGVLALPAPAEGPMEVGMDGRSQAWTHEVGRGVYVYF